MSVLVKGMEMPKNCKRCKFFKWSNLHQTAACARYDFEPCFKDHSMEYLKKRPDWCPLVDIPAPHGDLIDIDSKITIGIKDGLKVTTVRDLLNDKAVRLPKTVIEAEDGDEQDT